MSLTVVLARSAKGRWMSYGSTNHLHLVAIGSILYLPVAEVSVELIATSEPTKVEPKVVHNLTSPSLSE